MLNFPGWIGSNEVARFEHRYPSVSIRQIAASSGSIAARAAQVQQNPTGYDVVLADPSLVGQLEASGLVGRLDFGRIPNLDLVSQRFRSEYPHGTPNDYGKVGIGYRKDLIRERPTSWADLWDLAPKYSGKVVFAANDRDTMGSTLRYLGYSGNSTIPAQLDKCKQALIGIKPHLLGLLSVNVSKPLIQGNAVLAMDWDYDIALAQQHEKNIVWVAPKEGMIAYLNGFVPVAHTTVLPEVEAFLNFHLAPRNYANFVNTVGTAYVVPAATRYIVPTIAHNPILSFSPAVLEKVEFEHYLGQATALWSKAWEEVQAA